MMIVWMYKQKKSTTEKQNELQPKVENKELDVRNIHGLGMAI